MLTFARNIGIIAMAHFNDQSILSLPPTNIARHGG